MIWLARRSATACWVALSAVLLSGCAHAPERATRPDRPFTFQRDTFAYANQLVWEYHHDRETGRTTHHRREPPPTYSLHCFVVARSARQFFAHARFDPSRPTTNDAAYAGLIERVVDRSPRRNSRVEEKIVIPGYANLFEFSEAKSELLQRHCGSYWQSYFQRGHWRMILPFTDGHQAKAAAQLVSSLDVGNPPVIHVVRFPSLAINHALLVFDREESTDQIQFRIYDPNMPEKPGWLTYDRQTRRFSLAPNLYFGGGRVDVYQIFHAWNY